MENESLPQNDYYGQDQDLLQEPLEPLSTEYMQDPIRHQTELDNKIISTDYKGLKIHLKQPKFKLERVAEVYKNKKGVPRMVNGMPVVKRYLDIKVFDGYEEKEIDFPIKDLHTDSVTSSVLEPHQVTEIQLIDDLIYVLGMSQAIDQEDYTKTLYRLNGMKASTVDTSKALGGRAVELAKTTITKGESMVREYREQKGFDDYQKRADKKGLLGLGFLGL